MDDYKPIANWVINDLQAALRAHGLSMASCPVQPWQLRRIVEMVEADEISHASGRAVLDELIERQLGRGWLKLCKEADHGKPC